METTEKIVEAYVRYVRHWATIPNIKCAGQYEIDLLAVDPRTREHYHIESGVSVSSGFSKLTAKPFSTELLKQRVKQAGQRRTIGFFYERKFGAPEVIQTLAQYGFRPGEYARIIVTWDATEVAREQAESLGLIIWYFPELVRQIAQEFRSQRTYFTDDTLRTIQLYARAVGSSAPTSDDRGRHES